MTVQILRGDCRVTLAQLPAGHFHTCVTSPPYWGLRDYGTEPLEWPAIDYAPLAGLPPCVSVPAMRCSLGLEPTLEAFIGHMVQVFREVRRVLRDDGTCWVNMGDCYATGAGKVNTAPGGGTQGERWSGIRQPDPRHRDALRRDHGQPASNGRGEPQTARTEERSGHEGKQNYRIGPLTQPNRMPQPGLKPKDLAGQPWRLAFALQADGWWLRSDVIWNKPNPMPESTKDRPTKSHEYVFLLSKSERYYYDYEAIKEPAKLDTDARYYRGRSDDHKWAGEDPMPGERQQAIARGFEHMRKPVGGWQNGPGSHTPIEHQQSDDSRHGKLIDVPTSEGLQRTRSSGNKARRAPSERGVPVDATGKAIGGDVAGNVPWEGSTANKRSVWTLPTEGYKEAHFATFPTKLVEPCILAGCPEGGNVLDCFGGSGTTGLVADRLGRNAVLCELNPAYAAMADKRLAGDAGHVARQIGMQLEGQDG